MPPPLSSWQAAAFKNLRPGSTPSSQPWKRFTTTKPTSVESWVNFVAGFSVLKNDVWSLFGPLNPQTATGLFKALVKAKPAEHQCLLLDSEGGEVELTLGLIHELRKKLPNLEVRVVGTAASAAVHLLQAGGDGLRTAVPSARFYTHPVRLVEDLSPGTGYRVARALKDINEHWTLLLEERTGFTATWWRDFLKEEQWFGVKKALELRLIDEVV